MRRRGPWRITCFSFLRRPRNRNLFLFLRTRPPSLLGRCARISCLRWVYAKSDFLPFARGGAHQEAPECDDRNANLFCVVCLRVSRNNPNPRIVRTVGFCSIASDIPSRI